MRIKGKLNIEELEFFMFALGIAFIIGLALYGLFALLSLIHWILSWIIISVILTPIAFWVLRYLNDDISISDESESIDTQIDIIEENW